MRNASTHDESESLSDIDDHEVDGYLHNEEEKHYKKTLWEIMNREYLEEQQAKKAAKKAFVGKSRKEKKQRQAQEAKNSGPAHSDVEGTHQILRMKRLSSKVNYDRLEQLLNEPMAPANPKKVRFEVSSGNNHDKFESKLEDNMEDDELGSADEFDDGDIGGDYDNTLYQENEDET